MLVALQAAPVLFAQERVTVSGCVFTRDGKPLSGVEIKETGRANYTVSDAEGKFTITVSGPKSQVEISYIGYDNVTRRADHDFSRIVMYNHVKRSNGHLNLYFSNTELSNEMSRYPVLKSNYGAGISIGNSFFFSNKYKKPVAKFGIIADFLNLNYTNYEIELVDYQGVFSHTADQVDAGVQVGPVVEINPAGKLKFQIYGKYSPNFSILKADDEDWGDHTCFTSGFSAGANIVVGKIGAGVEFRSISGTFSGKEINEDQDSLLKDMALYDAKTTLEGIRAYLIIKF